MAEMGREEAFNCQTSGIIIFVSLLKNQDVISSQPNTHKAQKIFLQGKQHIFPPGLSYLLTVVTRREHGSVRLILTSSLRVSLNDDRVTPLDLIVSLNGCISRDIFKVHSEVEPV